MSLLTRTYIAAVIAAGAAVIVMLAPREYAQPTLAATFLAAMLVVSLFKLRIPLGAGQSTMSMAYVVDFTVLVTSGADLAMVIAAAGVLVQCTVNVRRRQPWYRTAFSVATVALAVQAAGLTWAALGGGIGPQGFTMLPLLAAAVPYYAVNSGLIAAAVALSTGASPLAFWRQHFMCTAAGCFVAAGVVAFTEFAMTHDAHMVLATAIIPMAICHLAYAAWFRRQSEPTAALA